jgi:hypothetical protein
MRDGVVNSVVKVIAPGWLEFQGYAVFHSPDISPAGGYSHPNPLPPGEGEGYRHVLLQGRVRKALGRLNPALPEGS